jgi:hypothetical protein
MRQTTDRMNDNETDKQTKRTTIRQTKREAETGRRTYEGRDEKDK